MTSLRVQPSYEPEELPVPLYALFYRYTEDADLVTRHRPEHRAYLRTLADAGELVLAGPLGEPGPAGGLLIFDVDSASRVEVLVAKDPFTVRGVVMETQIRPWALSIGGRPSNSSPPLANPLARFL